MKKSIFLFFAAILCAMNVNAWSLMGEVTDWGTGKEMTGDSKVVSVTVNLQANTTLKLKIKNGSTWYGNGGTMTSDNNLVWGFSTSAGDASIKTTDAGDYTFTWYINDKKLSVTYPNHNYIIAGDGAVMEDEWSPNSTKNKMSKQDDGTYRLTKTNRSLSVKTYGYKLTVGSWSVNQYPNDNVDLKVTTAGNYNVVFTYNPKNGQLSHELVPIYTITASANPATAGVVTGAGTYAKDASVTLEATPNAGYKFVNWTVGGAEKSTETIYSFTASANVTAVANFELSDPEVPTYAISVSANDDAMGTVTGAGDYTEGSPVTLTATPNAGYRFVNWTVGSEVKSTEATYSFTASEALTIVANFEAIPKYDITVKAVVPEAWTSTTIGIHYWGDGISGTDTPVATEKDGNWNKYTIKDVLEGQSVNVIFLNGTSWPDDKSKQTANITGITEDKCFQISAKTLDGEGKCTFTEVDCAADIKPEGDVYTMMGVGELGLSWDLATTGNDMTKQTDGTYTLVKEGLDLATTGNYEYKVIKNHSWGWSVPSGNTNQKLTVDKDGTYTITFTLSADKKTLTADAECTAEKEVILDCFVAGTTNLVGGTTDFTDELPMTYDEVSKTYSKTFTALAAGNYQMKVVYGSDWLGYDKLTKPVPANVTEGDDKKIKFSLAEAGDVTVTYHATNGIGLTGNFAAPAPAETKYYIAGDESMTGYNWNPSGLGIEDTDADGVYSHVFTNLAAGTYNFRITDGTWTNTWGWSHLENNDFVELSAGDNDNNIKLTLTAAKTVTVNYNKTTKKVSIEGLTAVTYTDITVQLYTEESAPQIWWWGSDGEQSKDADDTYDYDTSAPTMNAVAGEDNWYEWTITDVATHSGVIVRFKNSSTQSADYTVYENTCFDGRDLANTRTTTCGEVPTTCLDCSGIYLKGTFNEWLPNNEFKKTSDPNIVTLSINLTKGNHEFKIHGDEWYGNTGNLTRENTEQAWTYNKDEDKTPFRVDVAGDYKFSWNISEHKLTVTYPEFPEISNQPEKIYFLPNTNWRKDNATFAAFFLDGDKGTPTKWVAFTDPDGDGMYELTNDKQYLTMIFCRMDPNGTDSDNWKNMWNQSADITIPNTSYLNCWIDDLNWWNDATGTWAMPLSNGNNSATIAAAKDQTVTALVNRSFTKDDGWYTLALPFDMNAALVGEAYQLSGLVRKTSEYVEVNLEKTSTILAGQPYLILPSENKSYLLVENATIVNTAGTSISKSISGLSVAMQAIINGTGDLTSGEYWVGNGGMLYNTSTPKRGLRVLFNITSSSGIAPRMRVVAQEDEATGVEDITAPEGQVLKVIENGQLIIIRGSEKYNVQGVRL